MAVHQLLFCSALDYKLLGSVVIWKDLKCKRHNRCRVQKQIKVKQLTEEKAELVNATYFFF